MRYAALSPGGLTRLTTEGISEMRGLLTPAECEALAPPDEVSWDTKEPEDPRRSWSHTPEYRFGTQANNISPQLQNFLVGLRGLIQLNARLAGIPELSEWGEAPFGDYPIGMVGLKRLVYGAKWHRTAANHEIGWHTDDTFHLANRSKGEVGSRALGLMIAVSLTEHGGIYEYAPACTKLNPEDGSPTDTKQIQRIKDVRQGDAIGFCTARNPEGELWQGSFPHHRFKANTATPSVEVGVSRDSLVVYFRYTQDLTIRERGLVNTARAAKRWLLDGEALV